MQDLLCQWHWPLFPVFKAGVGWAGQAHGCGSLLGCGSQWGHVPSWGWFRSPAGLTPLPCGLPSSFWSPVLSAVNPSLLPISTVAFALLTSTLGMDKLIALEKQPGSSFSSLFIWGHLGISLGTHPHLLACPGSSSDSVSWTDGWSQSCHPSALRLGCESRRQYAEHRL